MTPPELDAETIHSRLRLIRELLSDLEPLENVTEDELNRDRLTRHAVERVLSQLVQLATAINGHLVAAALDRAPSEYRSSFDLAAEAGAINSELAQELKPSVGLRNVLTHEYASIDLRVVAESVSMALKSYREYVRQVATYLKERA